jgi:hypothetical protein
MARTQDPALEAMDNRSNPQAVAKFMESQDAAASATAKAKAKAKARKASPRKDQQQ